MIAIIGGGASGLLVAANLRRHFPQVGFRLFEPGPLGGAAYSTVEPSHLLNVRASQLSAWVDRPADFMQWAGVAGDAFAPRATYRAYLRSLIDESAVVRERVEAISGQALRLSSGASFEAEAIVLALGHLAAPGREHPAWRALPDAALKEPRIIVLGTGLTCVDVLLTLSARGYGGEVHAVSRHGWLPRVHEGGVVPARAPTWPRLDSARSVFRAVREHLQSGGSWQSAVDGVRPLVQTVWAQLPEVEKARLARNAATLWDVHRHRMAPEVNEIVEGWRGRLFVHRGRICKRGPTCVTVRVGGQQRVLSGFVVNALGPGRANHPLVQQLMAQGRASPGALGLGVRADEVGALIGADGAASRSLFTLGPLRRGDLWETTAIGEIREQAQRLACRLAHALSP